MQSRGSMFLIIRMNFFEKKQVPLLILIFNFKNNLRDSNYSHFRNYGHLNLQVCLHSFKLIFNSQCLIKDREENLNGSPLLPSKLRGSF